LNATGLGTNCVSSRPPQLQPAPWQGCRSSADCRVAWGGERKGQWAPNNLLFSHSSCLQKKRRAATARRQHLKVCGTTGAGQGVSQPFRLPSRASQLLSLSLLEEATMHNVGSPTPFSTPYWVPTNIPCFEMLVASSPSCLSIRALPR